MSWRDDLIAERGWRYFAVLFLPAAVVVTVTALLAWRVERNAVIADLLASGDKHVYAIQQVIREKFSEISTDLRWLAQLPELRGYLADGKPAHLDNIAGMLQVFSQEKAFYDQIRYLDEAGMELVRVNWRGGKAQIVARNQLQNKAARYYFSEALSLPVGDVYVSRLDLNVEGNRIEQPLKPVIRFAIRVKDPENRPRGMMVLNYLGDNLRSSIRQVASTAPGEPLLLNGAGYWLMAGNPGDEWGFMLPGRESFARRHPDVWRTMQADTGQFVSGGHMYSYLTLHPDRMLSSPGLGKLPAAISPWKVVIVADRAVAEVRLLPFLEWLVATAGVVLSLAVILSLWYASNRVEAARLRRSNAEAYRDAAEKKELLSLFFEHVPAAVAMLDTDMRYIEVSRRWKEDYQITADVVGRSHYDVFPEIPERWKTIHQRCLRGAVEYAERDPFPRADGRVDWLRWEVRPWYTQGNRIGGIVMLTEIITERMQAELAREEFVAKVSHELRTPLTAIDGALKLLLGGVTGKLPDQARLMVETAERNSLRLLRLVNDLLDLQRIKSGRLDYHYLPTNVGTVIHDAMTASAPLAAARGVNLVVQDRSGGLVLNTDAARISQVFTNLLANAVRFSPDNGQITVMLLPEGKGIRVVVADEGAGVPEQFQDRIFNDFAQADHGDTRKSGTSGLGLAISRAIVEGLGGVIGFRNRPEGGAEFFFTVYSQSVQAA